MDDSDFSEPEDVDMVMDDDDSDFEMDAKPKRRCFFCFPLQFLLFSVI